ncbi:MAG: hypothetical protein ACJAT2_001167 [Bacteriovoracaceae bacterium]|jgi:hypothetical protein
MKNLLYFTLLISLPSFSAEFKSWKELQARLEKAGGDIKMMKHMKCFMEKGIERSFEFKKPSSSSYENRCYKKSQYDIGNKKTFALIDYTKPSGDNRFFIVDRETGAVTKMAVAHGRYKSGYLRRFTKNKHNSVRKSKYFSNQKGSNAPASGFYLAGQQYFGKWEKSLILNGLEKDVNDNACERAVVIHGHKMVSQNKVYTMSSGCPMITKKNVDKVVGLLKGSGDISRGLEKSGSVVFIYGPREKKWANDYCGEI